MWTDKAFPAFKRKARRFARADEGGVTIEAVMWIPFFLMFAIMVTDASLILMNYARAQRLVHEFNRDYAVGRYEDCSEMVTDLETRLQQFIPSADAGCALAGPMSIVSVNMNTSDMDLTGATGWLGGMTVSTQSLYRNEYAAVAG